MPISKSPRMNWAVGTLTVFALVSIAYFNSPVTPADMDRINSGAGSPTEGPAAAYVAQFKADCILDDGRELIGTVSVPSTDSPDEVANLTIRSDGMDVTFAQDQARCVYAPY